MVAIMSFWRQTKIWSYAQFIHLVALAKFSTNFDDEHPTGGVCGMKRLSVHIRTYLSSY